MRSIGVLALVLIAVGDAPPVTAASTPLMVAVTVVRPCTVSTSLADGRKGPVSVACSADVTRRLVLEPAAPAQRSSGAGSFTTNQGAAPSSDTRWQVVTVNF